MRKLILLFVVIVSVYACNKSTNADCSIYPLSVGNSWRYKNTYYNTTSGAVDSVKEATVLMNKTASYHSKTYYIIDSFFYPIRSQDCNTLALYDLNTSSDIAVSNNDSINDHEVYNLGYGEGSVDCRGIRILTNKDRVVINNIDCYKIEYQFTTCSGIYYRKRYYYINEKTGLIKSEAYNIINGVAKISDQQELISSNLK